MAKKNEMPTEAPTPTPEAMPMEMAAPMPDMAAPAGGKVMVQMPSDAFDSIYTLVTKLQTGLETLKAEVDAQKQGSMAPEAAPAAMAGEEAVAADEDFLKSIAQEGSMR
jgi:hypothetical protein